jgi:hypothetical protein
MTGVTKKKGGGGGGGGSGFRLIAEGLSAYTSWQDLKVKGIKEAVKRP